MTPTVSCICITQNRRFFLRRAIGYFYRAASLFHSVTGLRAELVIVDGSQVDRSRWMEKERQTWLLDHETVRYLSEPSKVHARTGWFHNIAVSISRGAYIIQWDDDDWHGPERIVKQYNALATTTKGPSFAFTSKYYLYHLVDKCVSLARTWQAGRNSGSCGAMFAYHRATWEKVPFRDVPQGEDNYFWDDCQRASIPFLDSEDPSFCVYIRHHQNGSPLTHLQVDPQATTQVRNVMMHDNDVDFYDELTELLPLEGWNRIQPPTANPYQHRMQNMMLRRMGR